MAKMRNWKQHFHPHAEFVFRKRMKLNGQIINRGDKVTPEMIAQMGSHRLKVWWEAHAIELAPVVKDAEPSTDGLEHVGGGWYDVILPDGSLERVHGKAMALKLLSDG